MAKAAVGKSIIWFCFNAANRPVDNVPICIWLIVLQVVDRLCVTITAVRIDGAWTGTRQIVLGHRSVTIPC